MTNPFRYGGIVSKGAFCNRRQELADLARTIETKEWLPSIRRRFLKSDKTISDELILSVCDLTGGQCSHGRQGLRRRLHPAQQTALGIRRPTGRQDASGA